MTDGSLWRAHKNALSTIYIMEGGSSGLGLRGEFDTGVLQRMGIYEYTLVSNMRGRNYPTAYDVWCGRHGASLLTIYDKQELTKLCSLSKLSIFSLKLEGQ